jgi:hypothetical protein
LGALVFCCSWMSPPTTTYVARRFDYSPRFLPVWPGLFLSGPHLCAVGESIPGKRYIDSWGKAGQGGRVESETGGTLVDQAGEVTTSANESRAIANECWRL